METEHNLNSADFTGNTTSAIGAAAVAQAAGKQPKKWQQWLMMAFALIIMLATGAGMIDKFINADKLPGCDEQRTRDTLSDLNKANKINASSYNSIKQVSASDTEIRCTANLALYGGGAREYDYRIFRDGKDMKVEITSMR